MSKDTRFVLLFLCLFIALGACGAPRDYPPTASAFDVIPALVSPTAAFETIPAMVARSPTPSPTWVLRPSATPSLSYTATPGNMDTSTPAASSTPLACWKAGGRIETGSLRTKLLPLPLDYRVYLPPCYDQRPGQRYAVLYLIHGQSYNDDQWDRLGVDETLDVLAAAGEVPPFLIVMPYDRYGGQPTESNFATVLVEELLPLIDETYRTLPNREHRAVGGLSRGGGWAVHLAIVHWALFGALGAHSPAIFKTDAQRLRTWLDEIPAYSYPRIYIDIGDKDRPEILEAAVWFEALLNEKDIPHEWHLFSGYHNEAYWQAHIEQYIRWYAQGW